MLCPFFVPTGIPNSQRNRPAELRDAAKPTKSQLIGKAMTTKAVGSGKVTAAQVAQLRLRRRRREALLHLQPPEGAGSVQTRLEDIMQARNPTDPFAGKPEIGAELRARCAPLS